MESGCGIDDTGREDEVASLCLPDRRWFEESKAMRTMTLLPGMHAGATPVVAHGGQDIG